MGGLLERAEQLDVLSAATTSAGSGHGVVVLVHGEPGVGKSSLVRTYLQHLDPDTRTFVGACDDLITPRALGPLRDAVRWRGGPLSDALAVGADRDSVFAAVVEELSHPRDVTVLLVEDVHWADDATLDVLQYVVRRIDALRAVVVLTYRDADLWHEHPLRALLGTIPSGAVRRVPVPRLSASAVETLADGSGLDAAWVHRVTSGNAFFVTEMLAAGDSMPANVVDAVLARTRQLDDTSQTALEQLSVVPTGADHRMVERLVGGLGVLAEAEARGMLRVDRERVSFRHELARRAIEQSLPYARRVALNREVVAALLEHPDADLARIVHHAVEAGDADTVVTYTPAAAREAARAGAHREALSHFEQLLRYEERIAREELPRLLEEYAWELYNAHRFTEAAAVAERSCELWPDVGDDAQLGTAFVTLSRHRWMCGDVKGSWEAIDRATDILDGTDDLAARAQAHTYRGAILTLQEQVEEAVTQLECAQKLAEEAGSDTLVALCLNYRGLCEMEMRHEEEALALLRQSLARAKAAHDISRSSIRAYAGEHIARAYTNLAATLQILERWDELAAVLDEALPYTIDAGFSSHVYNLRVREAVALVHHGEWDAAEAKLLDLHSAVEDPGVLGRYMLPLYGRLLARRGRSTAEAVLQRAVAVADTSGVPGLIGDARLAYLEWAWLTGKPERAVMHLQAALDKLPEDRHLRLRAELIRYGQRAGLIAPGDFPGCPEPWAQALRGDWFAAAVGFQALNENYERALELSASGDIDVMTSALEILDGLGADAAAELVRRRMRDLGAVRVPRGPSAATRANPAGLTERQVDVLLLLREGLTNAEIAERLYLSVRTVDHHVAAILDKLEVPTRRQAADRAVELGLM